MVYDNTDGRSRSPETWPVGYRWQHAYGCYVDRMGSSYYLHVGGGRYYQCYEDGNGGFVEQIGYGEAGMCGRYIMTADGSNLVVWVRDGGRYTFEPQNASR